MDDIQRSDRDRLSQFLGESYAQTLYWKMTLYEVLRGESASAIIQSRGSASDYVQTLFPVGSAKTIARHYFVEALDETLNEVTLAALPPSALNHLLDLTIEFQPRIGFSAIVEYLRSGGIADSNFIPIGGAIEVDLHLKTLETLAAYFETAPLNANDAAFLTYIEILQQQMRTSYSGYAASELIKLNVLHPDSVEFKNQIDQDPDSVREVFSSLSHYASEGYGVEVLQALFFVCIEMSEEVSRTLFNAIESSGAVLEVSIQAHPKDASESIEVPTRLLRLSDDTVIQLNLSPEQVELIAQYEYEDDVQTDVARLLSHLYKPERQKEVATTLFAKSCALDIEGIKFFNQEIENHGGRLVTDLRENRVYIRHEEGEIDIELGKLQPTCFEAHIRYLKNISQIPDGLDEIAEEINDKVEETERAFAVA